jgi:rhamnose ABC transporter rhamnose-binding protein
MKKGLKMKSTLRYFLFVLALLLLTCSKQGSNKITVAMVPKLKGIDYFNACERGAREAVKELADVELIFDGPTEGRVDKQIEMVDNFITQHVDVIAVASNDPVAIVPVLQKARLAGIHVITYDADAEQNARELFINQATFEAIGRTLVDEMARQAGQDSKVAVVTSSLTAPNQNEWIKWMKSRMAEKYPAMQLLTIQPSEEDQHLAFRVTQDMLKAYPEIQGVWGISSVAFPGAAEAVQQSGKSGKVKVVGLSTPGSMKSFVHSGVVETVILWNPIDLGYLTIYAAHALVKGEISESSSTIKAGRLGEKQIDGDRILLGDPFIFTRGNIDRFDF